MLLAMYENETTSYALCYNKAHRYDKWRILSKRKYLIPALNLMNQDTSFY